MLIAQPFPTSTPAAPSRAEGPAETNAAKSPAVAGTKSIREDLRTLTLTPQPLARFPLDKDLSSEDNHIPPILRNAPSHLRSWLLDVTVNEEDKSWVQEHYEEVVEAMPVRLELWENNIILQIPSQIHQFAGRVIQRAMDKYESGTHSLTLMETADVPLSDKHWKQCDIQIYDLGPPPDNASPAVRKSYSYPTVVVEVGFSESAAALDFDVARALCLTEGRLWIGIALNIGKGRMPVLTISVFWFGLDLMSEEKVAEERIESRSSVWPIRGALGTGHVSRPKTLQSFLGHRARDNRKKWGTRQTGLLLCEKGFLGKDGHGPEQDIIIQEGYYKRAYKDYDAPALTIPADELWKALLKCKEVTGVLKSDMESYKNTGTTGEPDAEDSEPSERRRQRVVMEVDFDAPVPKKLKRSH
ncbi:uncharacterized protein EV420DRAFT_1488690 [Desarmillaria tabescens]|uniref:Restriction endonuclease domain-containing protein n=1 Tax=Armillaria tabescens TaxID=1929756 RepID=A0AA39J328_ARMTA|nr:uncharacterized protein EV420DRAFT_1488690 [Desarmillaria tabescens]KAK0434396.1 hypothetical protein EV420DRAFT_1488690 [Desarmillaria tabescens]